MTFGAGPCSSALNGVDLGCDGKQVITELRNGRTVINFTGKDISTIGFAGGRIEALAGQSRVLWVDGVYINQKKTAADGQCDVEDAPSKISIDCKAVLEDGRKLAASVKDAASNAPNLAQAASPEPKEDCKTLLRTHGFLSRAQFQCGYRSYSQSMLNSARACGPRMSEQDVKAALRAGMETFDRSESQRGHKSLCDEILRKFPNVVRK